MAGEARRKWAFEHFLSRPVNDDDRDAATTTTWDRSLSTRDPTKPAGCPFNEI